MGNVRAVRNEAIKTFTNQLGVVRRMPEYLKAKALLTSTSRLLTTKKGNLTPISVLNLNQMLFLYANLESLRGSFNTYNIVKNVPINATQDSTYKSMLKQVSTEEYSIVDEARYCEVLRRLVAFCEKYVPTGRLRAFKKEFIHAVGRNETTSLFNLDAARKFPNKYEKFVDILNVIYRSKILPGTQYQRACAVAFGVIPEFSTFRLNMGYIDASANVGESDPYLPLFADGSQLYQLVNTKSVLDWLEGRVPFLPNEEILKSKVYPALTDILGTINATKSASVGELEDALFGLCTPDAVRLL